MEFTEPSDEGLELIQTYFHAINPRVGSRFSLFWKDLPRPPGMTRSTFFSAMVHMAQGRSTRPQD